MILKLVGSVMVVMASSCLGWILSRQCAARPQELRILQGLLQIFENQISYMSSVLTDAFHYVYKSSGSEVAEFFRLTVRNLKFDNSINAAQAWEKAVVEGIRNTALNREDREILISFGKLLGSSDREGQIKNIRLTVSQLSLQEQKAEEIRKKNETMYRSLGILGGLAIVIIAI